MELKIISYLPHHIKNYGIGYAAHSLALGMNNSDIQSDIFSIHSDLADQSNNVKQAFKSKLIYKIFLKFCNRKQLQHITEYKFRRLAKHYDVIYLWSGASLALYQYLKKIGKIIIVENINCHQNSARKILENEGKRLGIEKIHAITDADIEDENSKLALADFIFSPSAQVSDSLLAEGISEDKIIAASYGLSEQDCLSKSEQSQDPVTALFVGSIIPRKGVHLLLDYWQAARPNGILKLIGQVSPDFEQYIKRYRNDSTIDFIPFTNDLASHYLSADIFLMPSLEEGSPLVTYLALGAGLPSILSPMAGEGVISNNIEGYLIEPHDKNAWVNCIQKLIADAAMRKSLEIAARKKAQYFLWSKVAQRRVDAILDKLSHLI